MRFSRCFLRSNVLRYHFSGFPLAKWHVLLSPFAYLNTANFRDIIRKSMCNGVHLSWSERLFAPDSVPSGELVVPFEFSKFPNMLGWEL